MTLTKKTLTLSTLALGLIFSVASAQAANTQLKEVKSPDGSTNLAFQGKKLLAEDPMYVEVQQTYVSGGREVSLVQTGSGGNACPAEYMFVVIENGVLKMSPSFGNCSDIPKISTKAQNNNQDTQITLSFPKFNSAPKATYVFDNGVLKEGNKVMGPWKTLK